MLRRAGPVRVMPDVQVFSPIRAVPNYNSPATSHARENRCDWHRPIVPHDAQNRLTRYDTSKSDDAGNRQAAYDWHVRTNRHRRCFAHGRIDRKSL